MADPNNHQTNLLTICCLFSYNDPNGITQMYFKRILVICKNNQINQFFFSKILRGFKELLCK